VAGVRTEEWGEAEGGGRSLAMRAAAHPFVCGLQVHHHIHAKHHTVHTLTTPSSLSTAQATSTATGARAGIKRRATGALRPTHQQQRHALTFVPSQKQHKTTTDQTHRSSMSGFFLRIANYIANELIVKGLANNRSFQRFALRTADHVEKVKVTGAAHSEKIAKEAEKQVGVAGRFLGAFQKEIEKDMKKFSQPRKK